MECGIAVRIGLLEFREKSLQLRSSPNWDEAVRGLQGALLRPSRKLKIIGFALPDEGATPAAVKRLARQRAEAIAALLASKGVDRTRFVLEVGDPATLGAEGYRVGRVQLGLDPNRIEPAEYDATYPDYENLCWIKYRTPAPADASALPPSDPPKK